MSILTRISRFLLILVFFSGVSFSNAAAQPSGRLIVIGAANFGWMAEPLETLSRVGATII